MHHFMTCEAGKGHSRMAELCWCPLLSKEAFATGIFRISAHFDRFLNFLVYLCNDLFFNYLLYISHLFNWLVQNRINPVPEPMHNIYSVIRITSVNLSEKLCRRVTADCSFLCDWTADRAPFCRCICLISFRGT